MDNYGVDDEGAGVVTPSGALTDIKYFILESRRGGVGLVIGVEGLGGGEAVAIDGVHLEAAG